MLKHIRENIYNNFINIAKDPKQLEALHASKIMTSTVPLTVPATDTSLDSITKWLSGLALLYGVPFNYLVMDEKLLPLESMRFFYLDNNWITALIDGAYSIGRITSTDLAHDKAFADSILTNALTMADKLRTTAFNIENPSPSNNIVTGFLLRSIVVSNWPGLEVNGYTNSPDLGPELELPIIRMDHLSPNILLCLFKGVVNYLRVHNPPEDIHFGFDTISNKSFTKNLKKADGTPLGKETTTQPNSSRGRNVININQLAVQIANIIGTPTSSFTSAEFALQMTEGLDCVQLDFNSAN